MEVREYHHACAAQYGQQAQLQEVGCGIADGNQQEGGVAERFRQSVGYMTGGYVAWQWEGARTEEGLLQEGG